MPDRLQCFTQEELTQIHNSAMHILATMGAIFQSPAVLSTFKKHGFRVEGETVFFEEKQVMNALKTIPSSFEITARNPAKSVVVGEGDPVCAPGYGSPYIADPNGQQHHGTLEDYVNLCKLVHTSGQIDMIGYEMTMPNDVPSEYAHLFMMQANLTYSDKPLMSTAVPKSAAQEAIEMVTLVWGQDALKKHYLVLPTINPISPMVWDENMAEAILLYAQNNQPIMFENLMMAGSTGPVTLAGTIVLQTAEILSGVVLTQLIQPGLPIIFGNIPGITDMRTGNLAIGAPETSIFVSANAQVAEFYGVPARSGGNLTDSHLPDMQAGLESMLSLSSAVRAGTTFLLHSCGILGAYMSMSYEKFIIDEEIIAMTKRLLRPISLAKINEDVKTILEVGVGGEFLSHPHTFEHFRTEHMDTTLLNRLGYTDWSNQGRRDIVARAGDILKARLENYEKPELDSIIEQQLENYVQEKIKLS